VLSKYFLFNNLITKDSHLQWTLLLKFHMKNRHCAQLILVYLKIF